MGERIKNYFLAQLDKTTAWIGAIIVLLLFIGWSSAIFIFAILLIFLPETEFTGWFGKWTKEIRDFENTPKK